MNQIKAHSRFVNADSNKYWPQNYVVFKPTRYDVYSVYEVRKHYLWCLGQSESTLEKLAVAFGFVSAILFLCFCVFVVF